jgi:hypothetical protein
MSKVKQAEVFGSTVVVEKPDDASSLQIDESVKGKISRFARRLSVQRQPSSQKITSSQKKEMELAQRRLESIAKYERVLQERIDDTDATPRERAEAASEKRFYESHSDEWRADWVVSKMTLKEGWGAGVYPEKGCGPGMWYR